MPTTMLRDDQEILYRPGRKPIARDRYVAVQKKSSWRSTAVVLVAVGAAVLLVLSQLGLLNLLNPFKTNIEDRTNPALLTQLQDLSDFHAATANFEIMVDLEKDVRYVPAVLAGERAVLKAVGSVDAVIDFSNIGPSSVSIAEDGLVTVALPEVRLAPAVVDPSSSSVTTRKRGIINRLSSVFVDSPTSEKALYVAAGEKMDAAAQDSGLVERAQANVTKTIEGLAAGFGYDQVKVVFLTPAANIPVQAGN